MTRSAASTLPVGRQRTELAGQLASLHVPKEKPRPVDTTALLDPLLDLDVDLTLVPEEIQRQVYTALGLEVRYGPASSGHLRAPRAGGTAAAAITPPARPCATCVCPVCPGQYPVNVLTATTRPNYPVFDRRVGDAGNGGRAMAYSGGYQVGHQGMSGQAGELDGSGDDVGKIRRAIASTMCYPQETLGGSETGPAFTAFEAAWGAETKVIEEALHQLADKVRLSSHAYRDSDIDVRRKAHAVHAVPVGSAADAGAGTMPVRAQRRSALDSY